MKLNASSSPSSSPAASLRARSGSISASTSQKTGRRADREGSDVDDQAGDHDVRCRGCLGDHPEAPSAGSRGALSPAPPRLRPQRAQPASVPASRLSSSPRQATCDRLPRPTAGGASLERRWTSTPVVVRHRRSVVDDHILESNSNMTRRETIWQSRASTSFAANRRDRDRRRPASAPAPASARIYHHFGGKDGIAAALDVEILRDYQAGYPARPAAARRRRRGGGRGR